MASAGQRFQVTGTDHLLDVVGCLEPDRSLRRWVPGGVQAQLAGEETGEDREHLQEPGDPGSPGSGAGRPRGSLVALARLDVDDQGGAAGIAPVPAGLAGQFQACGDPRFTAAAVGKDGVEDTIATV